MIPETRLLTDALMFVGGGSGSTAGGIKVTTLMILFVAARAEIRGHQDVNVLDRRIPNTTVRVAISVAMISLGAVLVGTMALQALTDLDLDLALFEVTSALATVGLSANVTPGLASGRPAAAHRPDVPGPGRPCHPRVVADPAQHSPRLPAARGPPDDRLIVMRGESDGCSRG